MDNPVPAAIFGGLLMITGIVMLLVQRKQTQKVEPFPDDQAFFQRRMRRRSQVAGMILLVGIMIPVGDSLISWKNAPGTFAVYWMIVIGLAVWIGLLAVGDMAATRAQMARELNRLHRSQLELHRVAQRARKSNQNHLDR